MKKFALTAALLVAQFLFINNLWAQEHAGQSSASTINLSGEWQFQVDPSDLGIKEQWFNKKLNDQVILPGSMTTNGKGDDITVSTPWTGSIVDSSWFFKPEYASYRQPGNIKVPFWLQPVKYYKGAAWYRKAVIVPASWKGLNTRLFIERTHWETTLWVDGKQAGFDNSLATPHVFALPALSPGTHFITVRVDNRVKDVNVGQNSHSITDHTQGNWNGMTGRLYLKARPAVSIEGVQLYPDIRNKLVVARISILNSSGSPVVTQIRLRAVPFAGGASSLKPLTRELSIAGDSASIEVRYPMGEAPLLWDEFHPNLYSFTVNISDNKGHGDKEVCSFGMREFSTSGTQFTINGRLTFLRGTLECAAFPKTGYPPSNLEPWMRIYRICRSYGLNHLRFHSWCPPEAAFEAADRSGFYLQIECSSWANQGATIGDGKPLDDYIYEESRRIVKAYGNHPSFCMMTYGNEPAGNNHPAFLTSFVEYWKKRDTRRLYTTAAGWPVVSESNYNSTPAPRIQAWGAGLKSIINSEPPKTDYDWSEIISKWQHPTVSHEIGQWCVYPDFKEIKKYDGVLKARNFEIFRDRLRENGMLSLADSFLLASGKLQALCYKADIEAALRTPGFGGFQLLGLYDFPGQGTALVGVLNPFWEDKGYINAQQYSRFCNAVVPLARFPKMIYLNNEVLAVPVEVANFSAAPLHITPTWTISNSEGRLLFSGTLNKAAVPLGNGYKLGEVRQSLTSIKEPARITLTVAAGAFKNSWDLFVYPAVLPPEKPGVLVTAQLDGKAIKVLNDGGRVLLTPKKGTVKPSAGGDIKIGFSSIFWNTAWTNGQPPHTLGILCNPAHPALKAFPTQYHSNWQWWDAMSHSNAVEIAAINANLKPIVRVIDDWVTARPLALVFECKAGNGRLMVSGIDLLTDQEKRPEARQLLYSLTSYMATSRFNPSVEVGMEKIKAMLE